jgi:1,4-dihydroxy-2-naphthoate polyprenyltransferase
MISTARSVLAARPASRGPWRGVWRLADPKITLASVASMLLGTTLAGVDGPLSWPWLGVTILGIFCLEAAKNASGEVFDWDSGDDQAVAERDRSPFSGGKRVLVDGLLTRRQTWWVAGAFYALGGIAGAAIVIAREPWVAVLGAAGAALAFFYHAPPLRLSYRGLGELAVTLVYGPLICAGTYLVQRHAVPLRVWLAALPLGILIGGFLWINEFPDRRADESAGKRTLVVRLGAERASWGFGVIVAAGFAVLAFLPLVGLPPALLLGLLAAPHAFAAFHVLRATPDDTPSIVPAQTWTLFSFVLLSIWMSAALIATRFW